MRNDWSPISVLLARSDPPTRKRDRFIAATAFTSSPKNPGALTLKLWPTTKCLSWLMGMAESTRVAAAVNMFGRPSESQMQKKVE